MKRFAIIIGNEGKKNFLPGVQIDIDNYKNFLKSVYGGAWYNNEIISSKSWTSSSLLKEIDNRLKDKVDYFLIIFTGHGFAGPGGETYLEISENDYLSLNKLNSKLQVSKTLIITDCCRKIIRTLNESRKIIPLIKSFSAPQSYNRDAIRRIYDRYIDNLEFHHHTITFACSLNEYSNDTDDGGLYSKSLMDTVEIYVHSEAPRVYNIMEIHNYASNFVTLETNGEQNPQIVSTNNFNTPPFLIF